MTERQAEYFSPQPKAERPKENQDYKKYVQSLPCGICLKPGPSEFHHIRKSWLGSGTSKKPIVYAGVPRCRKCHDQAALIDSQSVVEREIIKNLIAYIESRRKGR